MAIRKARDTASQSLCIKFRVTCEPDAILLAVPYQALLDLVGVKTLLQAYKGDHHPYRIPVTPGRNTISAIV